jgi:uncharacterized membrane protein
VSRPASPETGPLVPTRPEDDYDAVGESRWPMAIAVFAVVLLGSVPPARFTLGPLPLFPTLVSILLVVLVLGDPGRIDRRSRWLRNVSILLVGVLVVGAVAGTVILVIELVNGSPSVSQAGPLLIYAAKVWLGNNVAFALLYWNMDRGGAAERVHHTKRYPDFVFPQQTDDSLAGPGWQPRFIDYLYVGFTNANAFSPTDTLPLTGRAKLAMQTQALISFTILTLALARVVNAFA